MNQPKRLILILGDQLDKQNTALKDYDSQRDEVIMIESVPEAQVVWSHKAKIALFLAAMRHFAQELKAEGYSVHYIQDSSLSIVDALKDTLEQKNISHLVCIEPGEWRLKLAIEKLAQDANLHLDMREDDHFYCSHREFREWAAKKKELRLEFFYRLMRKTHDILLDKDGNPEGGQWNFDQDNRKPYPKSGPGIIETPILFEPDAITLDVIAFVKKQ